MNWPIPDLVELVPEPRPRDSGLGAHFASVFLQMAGGVTLSAACALVVRDSGALQAVLISDGSLTTLGWLICVAPPILAIGAGRAAGRLGTADVRLIFLAYAVLMGLALGTAFLVYAGRSVAATLIAAAAGFTLLSAIGGAAGRNLSGLGAFVTVALPGLIIAMAFDLLMPSGSLGMGASAAGVLVFAALAAHETDRVKRLYDEHLPRAGDNVALTGALSLYLGLFDIFLPSQRLAERRP